MESIKSILMKRDGLTESEAENRVEEAREEFFRMLSDGEDPSDICEDFFGLEPDYLEEFL